MDFIIRHQQLNELPVSITYCGYKIKVTHNEFKLGTCSGCRITSMRDITKRHQLTCNKEQELFILSRK
jgi:hypothetical protein